MRLLNLKLFTAVEAGDLKALREILDIATGTGGREGRGRERWGREGWGGAGRGGVGWGGVGQGGVWWGGVGWGREGWGGAGPLGCGRNVGGARWGRRAELGGVGERGERALGQEQWEIACSESDVC